MTFLILSYLPKMVMSSGKLRVVISRIKAGRLVFYSCEARLLTSEQEKKAEMSAFNLKSWCARLDLNQHSSKMATTTSR